MTIFCPSISLAASYPPKAHCCTELKVGRADDDFSFCEPQFGAEMAEAAVIAESVPQAYDFDGKRVFHPSKKRYPWFEGRPMRSFLTQPLDLVCHDLNEIRSFLRTCRYVSDKEQFGVQDHWMPPEDFERTRRGDCDDFALWTWRQLLTLGYNVRFVTGRAGRYGVGHAWVSLRVDDRVYVVEPLLARYRSFPRLTTLRYVPMVSVEATGAQVKFFEHPKRVLEPSLRLLVPLVPEWLFFRARTLPRLLLWPWFVLSKHYGRKYSTASSQTAHK